MQVVLDASPPPTFILVSTLKLGSYINRPRKGHHSSMIPLTANTRQHLRHKNTTTTRFELECLDPLPPEHRASIVPRHTYILYMRRTPCHKPPDQATTHLTRKPQTARTSNKKGHALSQKQPRPPPPLQGIRAKAAATHGRGPNPNTILR